MCVCVGKVDDRPIHSPSLYFSYNPDQESVTQLQGMFPNIPRAYIVRELDRSDGVVQSAVDRLVLLSADFIDFREGTGILSAGMGASESALDTSPAITSAPSTHHNLLKSLKSSPKSSKLPDSSDDAVNLTKKNWDKIDSTTRQQILLERKKEMLIKARESFSKMSND